MLLDLPSPPLLLRDSSGGGPTAATGIAWCTGLTGMGRVGTGPVMADTGITPPGIPPAELGPARLDQPLSMALVF